jgi:hypothetical protein
MKKIIILFILSLSFAFNLNASDMNKIKKTGFLTSEYCLENDYFTDCKLETYTDKSKLVLYVHNDLDYYYIDSSKIQKRNMDELFSKNEVTVNGFFNKSNHTIIVLTYSAPPPPKKEFFKGCM